MPDIVTPALAEWLKLGPLAVVAAALAGVAWRLWTRVETLQDRRVEDAQKLVSVIEANTSSRDKHTDAIERLSDSIRDMQIRRGRP